jgi:LAO/AO transport system kinase
MAAVEPEELARRVAAGERRALARAVTLVESTRADHRRTALAVIERLEGRGDALRLGLSGPPGVGKSTLIEALGMRLVARGLRVAVLAVDPSSSVSGGSILGDKTRMERLSREPAAFIRPSPAGATLGGVARRTREAATLCEAAGFDAVVIETVGVGQSETVVAEMTDVFALLVAPGGGDELQGVKRGVMEIADLVAVNKADGDLEAAARRTAADYAGALRLLRARRWDPKGWPRALTFSALREVGLDALWEAVTELDAARRARGWRDARRREQAVRAFRREVEDGLRDAFRGDARTAAALPALEAAVRDGRRAPGLAADAALALFLGRGAAPAGAAEEGSRRKLDEAAPRNREGRAP